MASISGLFIEDHITERLDRLLSSLSGMWSFIKITPEKDKVYKDFLNVVFNKNLSNVFLRPVRRKHYQGKIVFLFSKIIESYVVNFCHIRNIYLSFMIKCGRSEHNLMFSCPGCPRKVVSL